MSSERGCGAHGAYLAGCQECERVASEDAARLSHDRGADAEWEALLADLYLDDSDYDANIAKHRPLIEAALFVPAPTLPALDANWLDSILLRYANRTFGQKEGIECRDAILAALLAQGVVQSPETESGTLDAAFEALDDALPASTEIVSVEWDRTMRLSGPWSVTVAPANGPDMQQRGGSVLDVVNATVRALRESGAPS